MSIKKLKSFGLAEAITASMIVILVLSAAVALSSSVHRSVQNDAAYLEGGHLADGLFEKINLFKSSGRIYFDNRLASADGMLSIDCFDSTKTCNDRDTSSVDFPLNQYPYDATHQPDSSGYVKVKKSDLNNPTFPDDYFAWKMTVVSPESCNTPTAVDIPKDKCRLVNIDIKWEDSLGVKHYSLAQYFTDWER
jgi:hypothetical protein